MTSHVQRQLDIDPDYRLPYFYQEGADETERCLEVRMLRNPDKQRWQLRKCTNEYRGVEPESHLHMTLEHRFGQGQTIIKPNILCPICHVRPIAWFAFCPNRKPEVCLAQTACIICEDNRDFEQAVVNQAPGALPMTKLPLSFSSVLNYHIPHGPERHRVVNFILSVAGFPPADEITPKQAVLFFNGHLLIS